MRRATARGSSAIRRSGEGPTVSMDRTVSGDRPSVAGDSGRSGGVQPHLRGAGTRTRPPALGQAALGSPVAGDLDPQLTAFDLRRLTADVVAVVRHAHGQRLTR